MEQTEERIEINDGQSVSCAWGFPDGAWNGTTVILAHGAGGDRHGPFLAAMAERWQRAGLMTVRFNFLYKEKGGRLPDRADVLMQTWRSVAARVMNNPDHPPHRLFFAGKSLGGRIASMVAARESAPAGVIFLGYPLHPAGRPDKLRTGHLADVSCPMLFIQGTRDALCDLQILDNVLGELNDPKNELYVIEGADHSFRLPKKLGRTEAEVHDEIAGRARAFMRAGDRPKAKPDAPAP